MPAWQVLDGDEAVGRVTVGAWSPGLRCGIGYVRFERLGDWVGRTLSLYGPAGEAATAEIVALPFHDPDKRIPRGLDTTIP